MRALGFAFLAALAAFLAAGCGSDSADSGELADALPGDPGIVSYIDLDATREALELPDDADPADYDQLGDPSDPTPESQLVTAAASALPHVTEPFTRRFETDATALAIDHTQVSAAAASEDPEARAALLETDQPFDEIADSLESSGFELDGDVYVGDSIEPEVAFPFVADLGDGRVVVARERELADDALAGEDDPGEAAQLLAEVEQPRRQASAIPSDDACVTGLALGGTPGEFELEIAIRVDGEADAGLLVDELPATVGGEPVPLGEPEADGDLVHVTATPDEVVDLSALYASGVLLPGELYDCG
jgi:hypothetical protein